METAVFKQRLNVWQAIATVVGASIGASVFILLGPITAKTGPSLWLAYLIAAVPGAFSMLAFAQLGSAIPRSAGSYLYAKQLISPYAGFVNAWSGLIAVIAANTMMAVGFAQVLQMIIPTLDVTMVAVIVLLVFYVANLLGLGMAGWIQVAMVVWMIVAFIIYVVPGLFSFAPQQTGPFLAEGFGGLMLASALAVFSYTGWSAIAELGDEIENPRRNMALVTIVSFCIVTVIYCLVALVTVGVMPWTEVAKSPASVPAAAGLFLPQWAVLFIIVGAVFAVATTINAIMMALPREMWILGQEGFLPSWIGSRWSRTDAPVPALTVITVLSLLGVVAGATVSWLGGLAVVGFMISYALAGIASVRLPGRLPSAYQSATFRISPGPLGAIGLVSAILCALMGILAATDPMTVLYAMVIWQVVGAVLYFYAKGRARAVTPGPGRG